MRQRAIRLSQIQEAQLAKLSEKLQVDETNVIRLAISRLFEQEGLLEPPKR